MPVGEGSDRQKFIMWAVISPIAQWPKKQQFN
jgi:hypothetical protein